MASAPVFITKEHHGVPTPAGTPVPKAAQLLELCDDEYPLFYDNKGAPYPPEAPVFWIKHGRSVLWNEVPAQDTANKALKRLESPVKAPAVFYACEVNVPHHLSEGEYRFRSFIVMDYIPGNTAGQLLEATEDDDEKDEIHSLLVLALSEMLRIPFPQDARPAAELEDHLNKLLSRTRKTQVRVKDMALEPMVFCYPDVWLHNFIIDKESNKIAVVDFADASYLPLCFALIVLQWSWGKTERDLTGLISIPKTDNVDVANNVRALQLAQRPMIQSSGVWNRLGFELFGNERLKEEDTRMNETLKDANGHVMSFTYVGPPESLKRGPFNLFKTPPAST